MAQMKTVADRTDLGKSYLPSAGSTNGPLTKGDTSAGPKPTPAANSGKKLNFPAAAQPKETPMGRGKK